VAERDEEIALVEITGADLLLYYYKRDHAFSHQMTDPRARIIAPDEAHARWKVGSVDPEIAWTLRGLGLFSLAGIHYWRHKIDFDYFDIGANVGMTTITQAVFFRRCGRVVKVYAFEPGPVYDLLTSSVNINRLDDVVTCVRAAVGDRAGRAQFNVTAAQSPASSLLKSALTRPGIVESHTIDVDVVTVDDFVRTERPMPGALVKVDAEGFDFRVLEGMRHSMSSRLISFQIEFYPALTDEYADSVKRLGELTSQYVLIDLGVEPHAPILPNFQAIGDFVAAVRGRTPMPTTDIFAVPKRLPNCMDLVRRIIQG
jgi:FkbM family methyltransferase